MTKLSTFAAVATLLLLGAVPSNAQTVNATPGTQFSTTAVTDDAFGSSMTGMWVDAWFAGSANPISTQWGFLGGDYGVDNSGLRIELGASENTFPLLGGSWKVILNSSADLQRIRFRGAAGNTVFDRTTTFCILGNVGTPGSSCGSDVNLAFLGVTATYTNQVALNGTVYGDLYETLDIDFSNAYSWSLRGGSNYTINNQSNSPFYLYMDTDIARTVQRSSVPEPSTLAMVGAGLLAVGGVARRRRRA